MEVDALYVLLAREGPQNPLTATIQEVLDHYVNIVSNRGILISRKIVIIPTYYFIPFQ